jgi:hypothetical protein
MTALRGALFAIAVALVALLLAACSIRASGTREDFRLMAHQTIQFERGAN